MNLTSELKIRKMKRFVMVLIAALMCVGAAMADSYTINRDKLPQPAREFLTQYFPKTKVAMIKVDRHLLKKTDYDVKLVDGTKLEFNNAGKWTSVSSKNNKTIPDGIAPKSIANYVKKNYTGEVITEIEKKKNGTYEVELSAGIELKFSALGTFQKIIDIDD